MRKNQIKTFPIFQRFVLKYSCRICLDEAPVSWRSIFDQHDSKLTFVRLIEFCVGIQIETRGFLPQIICKDCISNLDTAFKLKKLSLNTEDKLKEIVSSEDKKLKASEDGANIPTSSKRKISERRKTVTKRKRKSKATENDGEPSAEINQKKSSNSKAERTCIWSLPHECSDNDVCFICNEPCSDKPEIIDHLNKMHRSTNDRLICPSKGCFSAFRYADSFFYHLISHFPCCGTKKLAERWK